MINAWMDGILSMIVVLVAIDLRVLAVAGVLFVAWSRRVDGRRKCT